MTNFSTNLKFSLFSRAVQLATLRASGFENGEEVVTRFLEAANIVNVRAFIHSTVLEEFFTKRFVGKDNRLQLSVMDLVTDIMGIYRTSLLLSGIEQYDLPLVLAMGIAGMDENGTPGAVPSNEMSCPSSLKFEEQLADTDTLHKTLLANDWLTALVAIRFCCPELLYKQNDKV